ncbi:hypothetical protein, partial [Zooshikella harenae]
YALSSALLTNMGGGRNAVYAGAFNCRSCHLLIISSFTSSLDFAPKTLSLWVNFTHYEYAILG